MNEHSTTPFLKLFYWKKRGAATRGSRAKERSAWKVLALRALVAVIAAVVALALIGATCACVIEMRVARRVFRVM